MKVKKSHTASLFSGAKNRSLDFHFLASTPETEEFRHSTSLPDYIEDKKSRGVEKSIDNNSVGSVKNHNQRLADLRGEVISDVKSGKPSYFIDGLPNFGNYEARAN